MIIIKNKVILFDWGNIVESHTTGYSCHDAWNDLFYSCGYRGKKEIFHNLSEYRLSCIKNMDEFRKIYSQIAKDYKFKTNFDEFLVLYKKIFDKIDFYKEVSEYEKSLKDKCYIGILSNLTLLDKERLDRQVNLSNYDYVFLSFEIGLKKPELDIYKYVQSKLPFKAWNILFIDDRIDNIETARKMGWQTFQATGLELDKIKDKCEDFLNGELK